MSIYFFGKFFHFQYGIVNTDPDQHNILDSEIELGKRTSRMQDIAKTLASVNLKAKMNCGKGAELGQSKHQCRLLLETTTVGVSTKLQL